MLHRGVAQPGLAHLNGVQGVGGSNPLAPINNFDGLQIFCSPFLCYFFCGVQNGVQDFLPLEDKKITSSHYQPQKKRVITSAIFTTLSIL